MDVEIFFMALDKERDERKLSSLELTGAWINEAKEVSKRFIDLLTGRVNRYPAEIDGGFDWSGIIMDTNPPDDDHWWYRLAEQVKPAGWKFFKQPGALIRQPDGNYIANPLAENVKNQARGYQYWAQMIAGKDREFLKVYIEGKYGSVFSGRPVYDGLYNDDMHVSPTPLGVFRGLPLILGWDFGLTPACIFAQITPMGVLNVLREYLCERGGIRQFTTDVVKPALLNEFHGMNVISRADPAGNQASQVDEKTCIAELTRLGIYTEAAQTNDFIPRRQVVINFLTKTVNGKPGFQLDPSCKMLRKGFNGGYQFSRIQVTGEERYRDVPNKNDYSHPHDGLQYLALSAESPIESKAKVERIAALIHQRNNTWNGAT